jgi:hypothetical protein
MGVSETTTERLGSSVGRSRRKYENGAAKRFWRARNDNALAVEDWIYKFGLLDESAVNGYWIKKYG